jgi:hypothetical protein
MILTTDIVEAMPAKTAHELMEEYVSLGWAADYSSPPAANSKTVAIRLNDIQGTRTYMFQDEILDRSVIRAVEFVDSTSMGLNPKIKDPVSGDYYPNLSSADIAKLVFYFSSGDQDIIAVPGNSANLRLQNGKHFLTQIENIRWGDCYILLTGSAIGGVPVACIRVWYDG